MGIGSFIKQHLSKPDSSLNQDIIPIPSSPPNVAGQKPTQRQIYQNRFNYGPNIGGMFLLEKWISGEELFHGTDKTSELDAVKATVNNGGIETARQKFEYHWTNWLNETNDWDWLKSKGITGIRVPIGYWIVDNGKFTHNTPFEKYYEVYKNAWNIFKSHVIQKAADRQIGVLVDLHGLPGGANGEDHSGTTSGAAEFWSSSYNIELTLEILKFIAVDLLSYDNISGIQVINEAPYADNTDFQKNYYIKALNSIRQVNSEIPVIISDGWNLSSFISILNKEESRLLPAPQSLGIIIDTHVYKCFSDKDRSKAPHQLIEDIDSSIPSTDDVDIMVGEYSCVMDEKTWKLTNQPDERDKLVCDYGCKQFKTYRKFAKAGQYFWTYKFHWGSGGEWGYREMIDKHALPDYQQQITSKLKSPEYYNNSFNDQLSNAMTAHTNYWQNQDPNKDWQHWRYQDGFTIGWYDAQAFDEFNHSEIGRLATWRKAREQQHIQQRGQSDLVWVFRHAFDQGVQAFLSLRDH